MAKALEIIPNNNCGICIFGDFNVNSLIQSRENSSVCEVLAYFNIKRIPLPPTRITPSSATSIDLVCTDLDLSKIDVRVIPSSLSDHTGQICYLEVDNELKTPVFLTRRHLNLDNLFNLSSLLAIKSWENIYAASSVEEAYSIFIGTLTTALDITCPLKKQRQKKYKNNMCYNPEVNELRMIFCKAKERYLLSGTEEDKKSTSQKKKAYDLKLQAIRKKTNEQIITEASNKNKAIWDIINTERRSKKKTPETAWQLNVADEAIENLEKIAEHFNNFFVNIAEDTLTRYNLHRTTVIEEPKNRYKTELSEFELVTAEEIGKVISLMKPKTSSGVDGISSKILKFCMNEVSQPIASIVNKSFTMGSFPEELKIAKVYPLHKQGSKKDVQNFRPISLIPTVSKIIEKAVMTRLIHHLKSNNNLPERQHGFLSGRSTTTALIDLIEHLIDKLEERNTVCGIFLDLSKAFDCLDHRLILSKLSSLGIKGTALKWFKSYLQGRKSIVEIKQVINGYMEVERSKPLEVSRGVPQGSVLGPVLFVLFIGDLKDYLGPRCYQVSYADDTVIVTKGKSVQDLETDTNMSIVMAQQYCLKNDLVFNAAKTTCITFGLHKDDVCVPHDLKRVPATKHLGVTIDERLSWNQHVDVLCARLSAALFAMKRIRTIGTPDATRTAYFSLIEAHIRYGIVLWGGSSITNLQRVLKLQKRAVRIMANLNPQDSCRESFKTLGVLTVVSIYIIEVILHVCKGKLLRNNDIHKYDTRHSNNFNLSAHRTALFAKKPTYAGARLYNLLPREFNNLGPQILRKRMYNWLVEESVYSIEEFVTTAKRRETL